MKNAEIAEWKLVNDVSRDILGAVGTDGKPIDVVLKQARDKIDVAKFLRLVLGKSTENNRNVNINKDANLTEEEKADVGKRRTGHSGAVENNECGQEQTKGKEQKEGLGISIGHRRIGGENVRNRQQCEKQTCTQNPRQTTGSETAQQ